MIDPTAFLGTLAGYMLFALASTLRPVLVAAWRRMRDGS